MLINDAANERADQANESAQQDGEKLDEGNDNELQLGRKLEYQQQCHPDGSEKPLEPLPQARF